MQPLYSLPVDNNHERLTLTHAQMIRLLEQKSLARRPGVLRAKASPARSSSRRMLQTRVAYGVDGPALFSLQQYTLRWICWPKLLLGTRQRMTPGAVFAENPAACS